MAADDIRINGFTHSWASTKITIDGEQYVGMSKIAWGHAIEEGMVRGQGGKPLGRTRGQYTPEAVSITMRKSSAQVLKNNLAAKSSGGRTFGAVTFPIVVQYLEPDDTQITVELNQCRVLKVASANEQGTDPTADDIEISCLEVVENGKKLFSDIVV